MTSINLTERQKQSTNRACINMSKICAAIVFLCFFAVTTSYGQGCDMGYAYSYTDVWTTGGDLDPDGDGNLEFNHATSVGLQAVGQGVVESAYNTCGHEYYTVTNMTGPDGSSDGTAALEITIDGEYIADSQLFYYCPIANRDFESGFSSDFLEVSGSDGNYLALTQQAVFGNRKACIYTACVGTETFHSSGCRAAGTFNDEVNALVPCAPGLFVKSYKVRVPFIPFPICQYDHVHIAFNPCTNGTL